MTLINRITLLLGVCLISFQALSQEKSVNGQTFCIPVRTVAEEELAYAAGERLTFTMHYEWGAIDSDVGTGTVALDTMRFNGEKVFRCSVYGRTTRLYDLFFKVREDFKSWFTCDGLKPMKFTRDTHEGKYVARNTYIYDWSSEEPHIIADVYSSSSGQRNIELPLTPCTFDLPTLFFFARNMDVDNVVLGQRYPMTFAIDDDVYNFYYIYQGREVKKIKGLGTFNTLKFAVRLVAGSVFTGKEDMTVWVTDDQNKVPLLFESPIIVGKVQGRLMSFQNLKAPLTSKIED